MKGIMWVSEWDEMGLNEWIDEWMDGCWRWIDEVR